jgi:hypothetical protein
MWTLSDESISILKKDAKLNHMSGIKNYDLFEELLESNPKLKKDLGHIIVSAQKDFENAMNLYGTIALSCSSYVSVRHSAYGTKSILNSRLYERNLSKVALHYNMKIEINLVVKEEE